MVCVKLRVYEIFVWDINYVVGYKGLVFRGVVWVGVIKVVVIVLYINFGIDINLIKKKVEGVKR